MTIAVTNVSYKYCEITWFFQCGILNILPQDGISLGSSFLDRIPILFMNWVPVWDFMEFGTILYNTYSFIVIIVLLAGRSFSLFFIFIGFLESPLKKTFFKYWLVLLWSLNLNYYGLMLTKHCLLKFDLKETKRRSMINSLSGQIVLKLQGSMRLPSALSLSSSGIFPSKIFFDFGDICIFSVAYLMF